MNRIGLALGASCAAGMGKKNVFERAARKRLRSAAFAAFWRQWAWRDRCNVGVAFRRSLSRLNAPGPENTKYSITKL